MPDERVSHEKREGNCRIVYFPGTDSERPELWNHEDCPVCRAERAERELDEAKPVLEAARKQATAAENLGIPVSLEFKCEAKDDWLMTAYRTEQRIEEYDAARAAKRGKRK